MKKMVISTILLFLALLIGISFLHPASSQIITKIKYYKSHDKSKSYVLKNITPMVKQSEITTQTPITSPDTNSSNPDLPNTNTNTQTNSNYSTANSNNYSNPANSNKQVPRSIMQNWTYKPAANDYYQDILTTLSGSGIDREHAKIYRFTRFPIKYWVSSANASRTLQVKLALKQMGTYFPVEEAKGKEDAQLIVDILGDNTILEGCPQANMDNYGCGGLEVRNNMPFGYVKLLSKTFNLSNTEGMILHELGHAFGIAGHSDDENDLMYLNASKSQFDTKTGSVSTKNNKDKEKVNSFSARDLNTLYKIYSQ